MYDITADPSCYPNSCVLRNLPGLRSQAALDYFETAATGRRFIEEFPKGRLSVSHYKAVHRHIFQDVYGWAGQIRNIRISKGDSMFCYPEHIARELDRIFKELKEENCFRNLEPSAFARGCAHFLAELNATHPFRDGNGRCQLAFLNIVANKAGYPIDIAGRLNAEAFLQAIIASFHGREAALVKQIETLII